jgi:hypothetical protein
MTDYRLKPGDLVSIEPWDCEGIESPWGWDHTRFPDGRSGQITRANRVKLKPGAAGFVVGRDHLGVEDYDTHYVVLVDGKRLGVPVRFLNRIET